MVCVSRVNFRIADNTSIMNLHFLEAVSVQLPGCRPLAKWLARFWGCECYGEVAPSTRSTLRIAV